MLSHSGNGKRGLNTVLEGVKVSVYCYPSPNLQRSENIFQEFSSGTPMLYIEGEYFGVFWFHREKETCTISVNEEGTDFYRELLVNVHVDTPYHTALSAVLALKYFLSIYRRVKENG